MMRLMQRKFDDPRMTEAVTQTVNRIHAMSIVHEILYSESRFADISFAGYLRKLVDHVHHDPRAAGVEITVEGDDVPLQVQEAVPLALIANEVVSNALKHAFAGAGGRIAIRVLRKGSRVRLEIADDGAQAAAGTGKAKGLGLQIVSALARQLDATMDFAVGAQGARFTLEFDRAGDAPEAAPAYGFALGSAGPSPAPA